MNVPEVITIAKSDVYAKDQGQMLKGRGHRCQNKCCHRSVIENALSFFKVIRQISRSHGTKTPILTQIGHVKWHTKLNIYLEDTNDCKQELKMLVISGLISLFGVHELISLLDINGLPLVGVQWVDVLHGWFSFGKLVIGVISTKDTSVSRRKDIYMVVLFVGIR